MKKTLEPRVLNLLIQGPSCPSKCTHQRAAQIQNSPQQRYSVSPDTGHTLQFTQFCWKNHCIVSAVKTWHSRNFLSDILADQTVDLAQERMGGMLMGLLANLWVTHYPDSPSLPTFLTSHCLLAA